MSLFGSFMGDLEEDSIFGHHMRSMRQMNSLMNSIMGPDPFSMMSSFDGMNNAHSALTGGGNRSSSLMPFGFQSMPNINRLLNGDLGDGNGTSFCSSSIVSMSSGPDGRPQVYQASSSTKTGPGGIKETRKSVQDSRTGVKKMAIGHHIGERAHIIEKEQYAQTGQIEERQEYINLDEDEAEDFNREFITKARGSSGIGPCITSAERSSSLPRHRQNQLALPAPPSSTTTTASDNDCTTTTTTTPNTSSGRRMIRNISKVNPRRPLRTPSSSPLVLTSQNPSTTSTSLHPHPYNSTPRRSRHKKLAHKK